MLKNAEAKLDFTTRLTVSEKIKDLPYGAVWAEFCNTHNVPTGRLLLAELADYQKKIAYRG